MVMLVLPVPCFLPPNKTWFLSTSLPYVIKILFTLALNFLFVSHFFSFKLFWEKGQGTSEGKKALYHCNYCIKDITGKIRIKCAMCPDFDLCIECFSVGAELTPHKSNHPYRVMVSKAPSRLNSLKYDKLIFNDVVAWEIGLLIEQLDATEFCLKWKLV